MYPPTPGSQLAKLMQRKEASINSAGDTRIKIVERGGIKLKHIITSSKASSGPFLVRAIRTCWIFFCNISRFLQYFKIFCNISRFFAIFQDSLQHFKLFCNISRLIYECKCSQYDVALICCVFHDINSYAQKTSNTNT